MEENNENEVASNLPEIVEAIKDEVYGPVHGKRWAQNSSKTFAIKKAKNRKRNKIARASRKGN